MYKTPFSINAVKSELSVTLFNKNKQSIKKLCAFTLAEILLSLSIIGIVATIALPSLLGNVNERAFESGNSVGRRVSEADPVRQCEIRAECLKPDMVLKTELLVSNR